MRTYASRSKKPTSQALPKPKSVVKPRSIEKPSLQAKSNEEGLAEWEAQRQKWARLGSPWMDKVPDPSGELAQPWIQRKLRIGEPNDRYEQEANRMAAEVVKQISKPSNLQENVQRVERTDEDDEIQRSPTLQRRTDGEASAELEWSINRARGSGQPLNPGLQEQMKEAMGADFSGVRVHTDAQSNQLNQSIQAAAFTTGQDVFFRQGAYQPQGQGGQELIAHELTHVVQQNGVAVRRSHKNSLLSSQRYAIQPTFVPEHEVKVNKPSIPEFETSDLERSTLHVNTKGRSECQGRSNKTGIPSPLLQKMEQAFGHDFSEVRVHSDSPYTQDVGSLAYTQGRDIHVAPGKYQPETIAGKHLLGHELTHVLQQAQGRVQATRHINGIPVNEDRRLESEADVMGKKLASQGRFSAEAEALQRRPLTTSLRPLPLNSNVQVAQGLTGFEVELHEPIYTTPGADRKPVALKNSGRFTPEIKTFLAGGLRYGVIYGVDKGDRFELSADHGSFANLHAELINALKEEGYLAPSWKFVSMTNLEYITPAVEERESGSVTKTKDIVNAVQNHITETEVEAKKDGVFSVPDPAIDLKTGIPKTALKTWIDSKDTKSRQALANVAAYKGYVYHQMTTGVLPSEIPELFEESATEIATGALPEKFRDVISNLLRTSASIAKETVQKCKSELESCDQKAVEGWLALVAQYLLAHKLEATNFLPQGTTAKNYIPLLSKTRLTETVAALPPGSRPSLNESWLAVFMQLRDNAAAVDVKTWSKELKDRVSPGEVLQTQTPSTMLANILKDKPANTTGPGEPLSLDRGQENLEPALKDPAQQAIPVEDRFASYKSKTARVPDKVSQTLLEDFDKAMKRRYKSAGKDLWDLENRLLVLEDKAKIGEEERSSEQLINEFEARFKKQIRLLKIYQRELIESKHGNVDNYAKGLNLLNDADFVKLRATFVNEAAPDVIKTGGEAYTTLKERYDKIYKLVQRGRSAANKAIVSIKPRLAGGQYV